MKFKYFPLLAIGLFTLNCGSSGSEDLYSMSKIKEGKVIVRVNGTEIHEGLLTILSELNPRIKTQLDNPLTRQKILTSLVEQHLLYQEAIKQNLDDDENVKLKSLLNRHVIISNALVEKNMDQAMQKQYEEKKLSQFTKLNYSQIFISSLPGSGKPDPKAPAPTVEQKTAALEKARAIKERLNKGEDFSKVATELSDDAATKSKGGKAGQITVSDKRLARLGLTKLAEEAFKLKKDQISEPIETDKGYYIVQVTSEPIITSFEDAKRVLGFEMQSTVKTKLVEDLKKNAKIEFPGEAQKDKVAKPADAKADQKLPPMGEAVPTKVPPVQVTPAAQGNAPAPVPAPTSTDKAH